MIDMETKGGPIYQQRMAVKDRFCNKCGHTKETCRMRRRLTNCNCTGECGCFVCIKCNQIPCNCKTQD